MFKHIFICVIIFTASVSEIYGKLPADVERCNAGDGPCMVRSANYVIKTRFKGDEDLNLASLDPIRQHENMLVTLPQGGPLNMNINFRNSYGIGYSKFEVRKIIGFGANPEGKHTIYLEIPTVSLLGEYSAKGNIYDVPVNGNGRANITFDETAVHVVINASSKVKNGSTYLHVGNVELYADTNRAYFDFTNLSSGDKVLSDTLNTFLKENWQYFYLQFRRPFLDAIELAYTDILRGVFDWTPYRDLVQGGN